MHFNPHDKTKNLALFAEKSGHVLFLPHVELSRSMVAILEMPHCVTLSKKSWLCFNQTQ